MDSEKITRGNILEKDAFTIIENGETSTFKINPKLKKEIETFLSEAVGEAEEKYLQVNGIAWREAARQWLTFPIVKEVRGYLLNIIKNSGRAGAKFLRELLNGCEGYKFAFLLDSKNLIEGRAAAEKVAIQYMVYAQIEKPALYERYDKLFSGAGAAKEKCARYGLKKILARIKFKKAPSSETAVIAARKNAGVFQKIKGAFKSFWKFIRHIR